MSVQKKSGTILASAARTASPGALALDQPNTGVSFGGVVNLHIIIDVTVDPAAASVQPSIQARDPASGKLYDLLAGIAAITAVGTTVLKVGKDMVVAAGLSEQDFLPENIVIDFVHADADSITYSVGFNAELDIV